MTLHYLTLDFEPEIAFGDGYFCPVFFLEVV